MFNNEDTTTVNSDILAQYTEALNEAAGIELVDGYGVVNEATFPQILSFGAEKSIKDLADMDTKGIDKAITKMKGDINRGRMGKNAPVSIIDDALKVMKEVNLKGNYGVFYPRMSFDLVSKDIENIETILDFLNRNANTFKKAFQGSGDLITRSIFNALMVLVSQSTIYVFYNYLDRSEGEVGFSPLPNPQYKKYTQNVAYMNAMSNMAASIKNRSILRLINRQAGNNGFLAESIEELVMNENSVMDFISKIVDAAKEQDNINPNDRAGFSRSYISDFFSMFTNKDGESTFSSLKGFKAMGTGAKVVGVAAAAVAVIFGIRYVISRVMSDGVFGTKSVSQALTILGDEIESNANKATNEADRKKLQKRADNFHKMARRVNNFTTVENQRMNRSMDSDLKQMEKTIDSGKMDADKNTPNADKNLSAINKKPVSMKDIMGDDDNVEVTPANRARFDAMFAGI